MHIIIIIITELLRLLCLEFQLWQEFYTYYTDLEMASVEHSGPYSSNNESFWHSTPSHPRPSRTSGHRFDSASCLWLRRAAELQLGVEIEGTHWLRKKKKEKNPSNDESFIFHEHQSHVGTEKWNKTCHEHYCDDFLAAHQARRMKYFRMQHSSSNSGQIISVVPLQEA